MSLHVTYNKEEVRDVALRYRGRLHQLSGYTKQARKATNSDSNLCKIAPGAR